MLRKAEYSWVRISMEKFCFLANYVISFINESKRDLCNHCDFKMVSAPSLFVVTIQIITESFNNINKNPGEGKLQEIFLTQRRLYAILKLYVKTYLWCNSIQINRSTNISTYWLVKRPSKYLNLNH